MMHQRKGKKILIYFFLLIIVGSINNIGFSKIKFENVNNINIIGLGDVENSILNKEIKELNLKNIFSINENRIKKIIDSNTLVEKYLVNKRYPSTINIKITKTNFLAKINDKDKMFLVGTNGRLIKIDSHNKELPFIFGKPEVSNFLQFKKIIDESKFSYSQIENFYFFPSKRWDLELKNKIVLKLPKQNIKRSLDIIFELMNNSNFKNKKIIDMRIQNQIIIND